MNVIVLVVLLGLPFVVAVIVGGVTGHPGLGVLTYVILEGLALTFLFQSTRNHGDRLVSFHYNSKES